MEAYHRTTCGTLWLSLGGRRRTVKKTASVAFKEFNDNTTSLKVNSICHFTKTWFLAYPFLPTNEVLHTSRTGTHSCTSFTSSSSSNSPHSSHAFTSSDVTYWSRTTAPTPSIRTGASTGRCKHGKRSSRQIWAGGHFVLVELLCSFHGITASPSGVELRMNYLPCFHARLEVWNPILAGLAHPNKSSRSFFPGPSLRQLRYIHYD